LLVGQVTRSMADNGVLPRLFSRNNQGGAPVAALIVTGLLASAMVLMSYSKSLVDGFTFLTKVVTAANLPLYLCCTLALAMLWKRGDRALLRDLLMISVIGLVYVVFAFFGLGLEPFLLALGLAAAGLPLYAVMRLRRNRPS
jgi:APA family basic amino acid/polyamine antiporter